MKFFLSVIFSFLFAIKTFPKSKYSGIERNTYALIISIGFYPEQPAWPKVNSTADVENIKYFINKFSPSAEVKVLRDEAATKTEIIKSLNNILKNCGEGDKIYLHFSGGGFQLQMDTVKQVFMPFDSPSVENVSDAVMDGKTPDLSHTIVDVELINLLQKIRLKIGITGQCLFTMDASHFGPKNAQPQSLIGRGGFLKVPDTQAGLSPIVMITSCLDKEESYFLGDKEPYSRSFSLSLKNYTQKITGAVTITITDLFTGIKQQMAILSPGQTPAFAAPAGELYVFGGTSGILSKKENDSDNSIEKTTRLFILSVGISNYNGPYALANCDEDAKLFANSLKTSWKQGEVANVKTWLLLNEAATKDAILKAINEIITQAKDEDVFAFFFAGFTNQPKIATGGFEETWFFPTTNNKIDLSSRNGFQEKDIITLSQLKKLFDYIKSDRQLLFTEAGPSENFRREFVKLMIKTNPVITEIRKRNRVIIVPDTFGWDAFNCNQQNVKHGPGVYFFSQLSVNEGDKKTNVFDLFDNDEVKRRNVIYQFRKSQFKCQYPDQYISFFFEKEFVEDLQYFFTKDNPVNENKTRGAGEKEVDEKILTTLGNKYALVIGTDKFSTWGKLQNPVSDAVSIADTLTNLFGYKTTVLKNPALKDIYNSLYAYRNILQENDQFILYLAGHGYYDSTIFKDGFIVTSDSKALRADTFLSSYIPFNQLRTITDNFKAKQIMVLLDVCFSGAFDDNDETLSGNINYNLTGKLTDKSVGKKLQMTTRKYITAGSSVEEVADDYNGQHSPFAYFLLEGLRRAAKEKKYLSSGMLYKFIQSYLEETIPLQAGFGKDQEKSGSEFIFIPK